MKSLLLTTVCLALGFCLAGRVQGESQKPCCAKPAAEEASAPFTDASIYQVESLWTNDLAKPMQLGELRGKPQVITMFFANCEYACPILAYDMKRIEAALPEAARTNTGFALVSFDTERDTVEELAKFRTKQELDSKWTLLRGGADDVLELAALLGIKYKKDARGQFAHSNVILVLNAEGEIVHQQIGLNQPVDETVSAILKLQREDRSKHHARVK